MISEFSQNDTSFDIFYLNLITIPTVAITIGEFVCNTAHIFSRAKVSCEFDFASPFTIAIAITAVSANLYLIGCSCSKTWQVVSWSTFNIYKVAFVTVYTNLPSRFFASCCPSKSCRIVGNIGICQISRSFTCRNIFYTYIINMQVVVSITIYSWFTIESNHNIVRSITAKINSNIFTSCRNTVIYKIILFISISIIIVPTKNCPSFAIICANQHNKLIIIACSRCGISTTISGKSQIEWKSDICIHHNSWSNQPMFARRTIYINICMTSKNFIAWSEIPCRTSGKSSSSHNIRKKSLTLHPIHWSRCRSKFLNKWNSV